MDQKHKTKFDFTISEAHIVDINSDPKISKASLKELKSLLPEDLKLDVNKDLVGIALNVAVVNKFNKNHDGIGADTALAIVDLFKNKPVNIEHEKNMVIGHIVDANFSDASTNEILSSAPSSDSLDPFNISLSAVLYRVVDPNFVDAVVASGENGLISGSWEVGFTEYVIAKGPKDMKHVRIISDSKEIETLTPRLKTFGGEGVDEDGMSIYTLIKGTAHPLGMALTSNPAADVKGVFVDANHHYENKKSKKNKAEVSHKQDIDVKDIKQPSKDMEKLIEELTKVLEQNNASHESVASLTSTFADAIKDHDKQYKKQIAAEREAKEQEEAKRKELDESLANLKGEFENTKETLEQLKKEKEVAEARARFDSRFREITDAYQLDEDEKKVIASDLELVDETEESFASYKNKLAVLFKNKTQEAVATQRKEIEDSIKEELKSKLAEKAIAKVEDLEKALSNLEETKNSLPNGTQENEELSDKITEAFNQSITVK